MTEKEINMVIDVLSTKLSVPASKLMGIISHIGLKDFVGFVFSLTLLIISIAWFVFSWRKFARSRYDSDRFDVVLFSFFFVIVMSFIVIITLGSVVLWVCYPDAWALNYIVNILK